MRIASPPQSDRLSRRLAAAAVLVPLGLGLTWAGGWAFAAMIIGFAGLMGREWSRICGFLDGRVGGWALPVGLVLLMVAAEADHRYLAAGMVGVGLAIALLIMHAGSAGSKRAGWLAVGVAGILPAGLSLLWMRGLEPDGMALIFWVMLVVWVTDSAAYAVGRSVGGPRLAPRISPAKTWSGLLGGLAAATLVGGLAAMILTGGAFGPAALAGLAVGIAGGLGDLFESHLKRQFKVKDSGGLIPGHGGVMDRLDSLLAAAPVTAALNLAGWHWL
ncbi:MAG: phosphatidate cytidylyltransferase [Alphaproteobacteria bacterium]|nr:phosphatidate cytidylyltransferase [Alphaproteobacteria bacterium]